ncbi:hypothetical protein DL96DRAFT_1611331 [Flagelloscypha sp. PMI_526]|nr:hypothetical protein DL96DRAFT_1611331 [Flagelloscypha sp. PMI_526]
MDFTPAQSPTFEDAELAIMSHHAHCSSLQDQNVLVPLHKLPAELLHLVFVHHREAVFEQGQSNFWWARGCTDVCSWWRRLILQSPQLWSTIKAERREDALKVLLERSRSSLLSVLWNDRFSSHIQVILTQIDRIKHLEMDIQSYSLKFFGEDANLKQAAMLKYLRVTWFGEDNKAIAHFVSQHCGGLNELIIRCESNFFRLAQFQPALQSLRCLELHDPPEHVRRVEPTSEPRIHLPHLEVFKLMNFSLQRALCLLKLVSSNRPVAVECEIIAGPDDSLICEVLPAAKRLMALSSWEDIRVVTYVSTQLFGRVPHGFCFHGSTPLAVSIIPVTHRRQVDAEHVLWKTNSQLLAPFTSFDVLFLRGSAATESLRLLQFFGITTLVLHHHTQSSSSSHCWRHHVES